MLPAKIAAKIGIRPQRRAFTNLLQILRNIA